ncbi:MAG: thioredoxin-disulfide reductase [Desulfomonilaceae bacterium]|nr:thioredoxin-disulfide reductase [Desulfomonilaceae bacterium]
MHTDLVVLGGGPAGLAAGMYASRARISSVLIEKGQPGGQMAATEIVENYPGFVDPIYGAELSLKMEAHARKFGLEVVQADILSVEKEGKGFTLTDDSGTVYSCRALIIATGASPVKLGIPGELELAGKGVSYCAVCDGPFFRDFEVAVIGGGDSAVQEAVYLTRFATRVHLIHRRDELRALKELQEKAFGMPRIVIHWSHVPVEITGVREVEGIRIRSAKDGSEENLPVGGVFFYVGLKPSTEGLKDLVDTDYAGFILTDDTMATSTPGVFAAGDVRCKQLRQIATAVGDGATAAFSAQHYLEKL